MKPKPEEGTPSPFAARAKVQSLSQETVATPTSALPKMADKKSPVWPWVLAVLLATGGGVAWYVGGASNSAGQAEVKPAGSPVAQVPKPPVQVRDDKADFEFLARRAAEFHFSAEERLAVASAMVRAERGAIREAVEALGPMVADAAAKAYADAATGLREVKLEDHTGPAASGLKLELAKAEEARRMLVWAEAVARYDASTALLPSARREIAANLSGLAEAAAGRGDADLATLFFAQALRLNPGDKRAEQHLYRFKFSAGQKIKNQAGMTLVYVPPGEFLRGSPANEPGRAPDEIQSKVILTKGFFMGATEVTQREWDAVFGPGAAARLIGASPTKSRAIGPDLPMHSISHEEAEEFCRRLSEREGVKYRLPTEAEWEHATRAGTTTAFSSGTNSLSAREANIDDGSASAKFAPAPVGSSGPANPWGLFDVHGNVWEWCADWSGPYRGGEEMDPTGVEGGNVGRVDLAMRVVRGGGWNASASDARSANRWEFSPVAVAAYLGMRVVAEPDLISK